MYPIDDTIYWWVSIDESLVQLISELEQIGEENNSSTTD